MTALTLSTPFRCLPLHAQVILLFQNIDGVDLCLYCLYMQEYGEDAPAPNRKSGESLLPAAFLWVRCPRALRSGMRFRQGSIWVRRGGLTGCLFG